MPSPWSFTPPQGFAHPVGADQCVRPFQSTLPRRGAPPGNTNARTHGFYARVKPPSIALALTRLQLELIRSSSGQFNPLTTLHNLVKIQKAIISQPVASLTKSQFRAESLAFLKIARVYYRIHHSMFTRASGMLHLTRLAASSWLLGSWSAIDSSLPAWPVLLPLELSPSRAPLSWSAPSASPASFLNDRHWLLFKPILDQLQNEHASRLQRTSRQVDWPARFLLDGIFWKLATACSWNDLPYPWPVRRCQKLYRLLCTSGAMAGMLSFLHQDLHAFTDSSLTQLALTGRYRLVGSRILYLLPSTTPPPSQPDLASLISPQSPAIPYVNVVALLLFQCIHKSLLSWDRKHPRRSWRNPPIPQASRSLSSYQKPVTPPSALVPPDPSTHPQLPKFMNSTHPFVFTPFPNFDTLTPRKNLYANRIIKDPNIPIIS